MRRFALVYWEMPGPFTSGTVSKVLPRRCLPCATAARVLPGQPARYASTDSVEAVTHSLRKVSRVTKEGSSYRVRYLDRHDSCKNAWHTHVFNGFTGCGDCASNVFGVAAVIHRTSMWIWSRNVLPSIGFTRVANLPRIGSDFCVDIKEPPDVYLTGYHAQLGGTIFASNGQNLEGFLSVKVSLPKVVRWKSDWSK